MVIFYFTALLRIPRRSSENIGHKVGKLSLYLVFHTFQYVRF